MELNKKIKPFSPQHKTLENNENRNDYRHASLIDNKTGNSLKEDFNKIIMRNLYNDERYIEAAHVQQNEKTLDNSKANMTNNSLLIGKPKSPKKDYQQELPQKLSSIELTGKEKLSQSLKVSESMPVGMIEFGKFLINHIEKEENYRILLDKELKKIKMRIKKIFDDGNKTKVILRENERSLPS